MITDQSSGLLIFFEHFEMTVKLLKLWSPPRPKLRTPSMICLGTNDMDAGDLVFINTAQLISWRICGRSTGILQTK
jgi:hypothetical protein